MKNSSLNGGALLVHKLPQITSFGVIEELQNHWKTYYELGRAPEQADPSASMPRKSRRSERPKLGHGGTLDPFATGLLVVLCGNAVKLAQYFLGATKTYEGIIQFGKTTVPGDPTSPITETSTTLPKSLAQLQDLAHRLCAQPYHQTPPMHSAKKKNGRPLYELARQGIEIERKPQLCHLYSFSILNYDPVLAEAQFHLRCSSGTYVRTLAQDFAKLLGSVGMLKSLHRPSSGVFSIENALTLDQMAMLAGEENKKWEEMPNWVEFDRLLDGYARVDATEQEATWLEQGKQSVLIPLLKRTKDPIEKSAERKDCVAIYHQNCLLAMARLDTQADHPSWKIDRVFPRSQQA